MTYAPIQGECPVCHQDSANTAFQAGAASRDAEVANLAALGSSYLSRANSAEQECESLRHQLDAVETRLEEKTAECLSFYNEAETVIKQRNELQEHVTLLRETLGNIKNYAHKTDDVLSWCDEALAATQATFNFQANVAPWLMACFGEEISNDRVERNHRFLEESLELVQSLGCTHNEANQLVNYVFSRPDGDPPQEVGGVMVTLAALCLANQMDMHRAGEIELARIWTKIEQIRKKQATKPKHGPLPEVT